MAYATQTNHTAQSAKTVPVVEVRNNTDIEIAKILYRIVDFLFVIIIVALICGVALGWYATQNNVILYSATSKAFLANNVDALQALGIADLQLGELVKQDYIAAFTNRHVHEEVIKILDLPYTPEKLLLLI